MAIRDKTLLAFPDVDSPLCMDNEASFEWDEIADVVVIGFGGAVACAAIEAREGGADNTGYLKEKI